MDGKPDTNQGGEGPRAERAMEAFIFDGLPPREALAIQKSAEALATLIPDLQNPGVVDAAVTGFCARMLRLEQDQGTSDQIVDIFSEARITAGRECITAGYADLVANIITPIASPARLQEVLFELQDFAISRGRPSVSLEIEQALFAELDQQDPQKAIELLRAIRTKTLALEANKEVRQSLKNIDAALAERIGPGYDSVADWAATASAEFPGVDWDSLIALVRRDELWFVPNQVNAVREDNPATTNTQAGKTATHVERIIVAHGAVKAWSDMTGVGSVKGKTARQIIDRQKRRVGDQPQAAAISYLDALTALEVYRSGNTAFARTIVKEHIQLPEAVAYVAEGLLRQGTKDSVAEARRLIFALPEPLLINMLLDGPWPQSDIPQRLLAQIVELSTKRTSSGKGPVASVFPLEMRVNCMNALADRCEQEGNSAEAAELRRRIKILRWQFASGFTKYMPTRA